MFLVSAASGQSPTPPLSDSRLTVHTLVREDIFAGWRADDMERLSRGEQNIELLLKQRPRAKAELLAWKGGAKLYRAVLAHEDDRNAEFKRFHQEALDSFSEARKLNPTSGGVAAVAGGSYVMFADRLPEQHRAAAWSEAYDYYHILWSGQAEVVSQLPVHIRGKLLAGLAQSAHRTGRIKESEQFLDRILEQLKNTRYERAARRWKKDPQSIATSNITCKSCHSPGRLEAQIAAIENK